MQGLGMACDFPTRPRAETREMGGPSSGTAGGVEPTALGVIHGPVLDVDPETVAGVEALADALCRLYERMPEGELVAEADERLALAGRLLALAGAGQACDEAAGAGRHDGTGEDEQRRLSVASGWLSAVGASACFDAGEIGCAEVYWDRLRDAARQARHPELGGWAWQLSAQFALAEGRYEAARLAARTGQILTTDTPAAAHLALAEALAAARLGSGSDARAALDRAEKTVDRVPHDEGHCFGVDEARLAGRPLRCCGWVMTPRPRTTPGKR